MASRVIFSCDWCNADSPKVGFVGDDWKERDHNWLCATCAEAYDQAVRDAKAKRWCAAYPMSSQRHGEEPK